MERKRKRGPSEEDQEEARRKLLREALGYLLPAKEAGKICESLLGTFGSFDGVFAAPESILRDVPGVGPEVAGFLRKVIELSQAYLEERSWNLLRVHDTLSAVEVFRPKFLGRRTECVCLMLLDGRGRILYNDVICEGSLSEAPLRMRQVLRLCIEYEVEETFLAHNHPSGVAVPSFNDLLVTDRLLTAMAGIECTLSDHIIFAGDSYFSFRESGVLGRQEELVRESQLEEMEAVRKLESRLYGKNRS